MINLGSLFFIFQKANDVFTSLHTILSYYRMHFDRNRQTNFQTCKVNSTNQHF